MKLSACIDEHVGRLVHPAAQASPETAARHRFFIETRLAVGFAALGALPFYLATGSVPGAFEAAVLACLVLPFVAVAVLSARGRLFEAELISALCWAGLVTTLVAGHLASSGAAAGLLILIPLEASFGESATKLQSSAALACLGGVLVVACTGGSGAAPLASWILLLGACHGALLCTRGGAYRREASQRAQQRSREERLLEDAISDVIIRFDGVAATVVNPRAVRPQLGLEADDLAGRGFFDRIHLADRPAFLQLMSDAAGAEPCPAVQLRLRTSPYGGAAPNEPAYCNVDVQPGRTATDDPRARFSTLVQVRAAMAEPALLPIAGTSLASADETWRDRLLANISHELRTPLNAIIGFSEMLASETHLPVRADTRREYAEIIHASGQHLLSIVNSMLDLSKIDAGKFELTHEPFDVADLIASCCDMVRLKAEQARIDVACRIEPEGLQITADKRACRQIVLNLLSNAIKFTPEYGRVSVEARLDGAWLALVVADTGIGMLPQDLARLGDRFFQAQNATTRRFEGTGLGLSLVSGLVALHGGAVTAESAAGQGTRMSIRLPREASAVTPHAGKARIETVSLPSRSTVSRDLLNPKVKKIA